MTDSNDRSARTEPTGDQGRSVEERAKRESFAGTSYAANEREQTQSRVDPGHDLDEIGEPADDLEPDD
jgi:hypothetical protein